MPVDDRSAKARKLAAAVAIFGSAALMWGAPPASAQQADTTVDERDCLEYEESGDVLIRYSVLNGIGASTPVGGYFVYPLICLDEVPQQ